MHKSLYLGLILCIIMAAPNTNAQSFGNEAEYSGATNNNNTNKKILRNPIINQTQKAQEEQKKTPKIMLYYRNFKVDTTPSGRIMCDFDIVIHNSTPNKINTLNMQLIWPKIKTSASFYDVQPRQENYLPMALLGNGCYSMDKAPNIVVNLCRIKGMSGEECANSLMWVKVR